MSDSSAVFFRASSGGGTTSRPPTKHKRRYCKIEGCTRIVKSQGLCQRHGAKPCKCKVDGCLKQAQGNFNGMCKAHFRETLDEEGKEGTSVTWAIKQEAIACITATAMHRGAGDAPLSSLPLHSSQQQQQQDQNTTKPLIAGTPEERGSPAPHVDRGPATPHVLSYAQGTAYAQDIPASIGWTAEAGSGEMPLVKRLEEGYRLPRKAGWHRQEERAARSLAKVTAGAPLEAWEKELVFIQTLILSGTAEASFQYLAHAWALPPGFHQDLGRTVCGPSASSSSSLPTHEVSEEEPPVEETTDLQQQQHRRRHSAPLFTHNASSASMAGSRPARSPLDTLIAALSAADPPPH